LIIILSFYILSKHFFSHYKKIAKNIRRFYFYASIPLIYIAPFSIIFKIKDFSSKESWISIHHKTVYPIKFVTGGHGYNNEKTRKEKLYQAYGMLDIGYVLDFRIGGLQ